MPTPLNPLHKRPANQDTTFRLSTATIYYLLRVNTCYVSYVSQTDMGK